MTQRKEHILIGFAEALPGPEVFFSLYDAGYRVSVFTREGANTPLARHLPLEAVHTLPAPERSIRAASDALAALMSRAGAADLVLPLDDAALWLVNDALPGDARIAGATDPQAAFALDKTQQITEAQAAGLSVPETVVVWDQGDLDQALPFPAIAKPALAIAVRAGAIAKDKVHYLPDRAAADRLAAEFTSDMAPLLVQPLLAGTGEGVFGFAGPDGVTHWSGHRRLRMMNPHGSGSSACLSQDPSEDLQAACTRFLDSVGWRGPFMIELLRDPQGVRWFMELNGRMWGSMALARAQGLEYPAWAAAAALDPAFRPPPVASSEDQLELQHLGRDLLHLLFVLRGPKTDFYKADWPRFGHSLSSVLRAPGPRRRYNAHPDFPGFVWRDTLHTVLGALRR